MIFRHYDPKHYISIKILALRYAISGILNQIIVDLLDHLFSNYVFYKNLYLIFSKSEIDQ